ncbi:hypothetical protein JRO89_XS04G0110100 [Xanthoceras sorbifolium]|uniref:Uncharacterized protein n=1 Tax=Xanthoceras sorbifolium TaxID=99658 RepID=A0ABQ8I4S3_9ROSI|nr:hypothetical protein JRO89_XS04G0110100 [Xanthoceras sorbifolium]
MSVKSSSLFMWKSITWGRELLVMRSGTTISIYKDRWIPRPSTFRVLSPPVLDDCVTVHQLKHLSSSWNVKLIRSSFSPIMFLIRFAGTLRKMVFFGLKLLIGLEKPLNLGVVP